MKPWEIAALPVKDIANENSVLFIWATFPNLIPAIQVVEAWGFVYKTAGFTWLKQNRSGKGLFFGVGYYSKSNAEVCLLATRGKPLKPSTDGVSSAILSPLREHSRKPDEARHRIEQLYPDKRKIELFARQSYPGWDALGNGIDGRDIRESLEDLIEKLPAPDRLLTTNASSREKGETRRVPGAESRKTRKDHSDLGIGVDEEGSLCRCTGAS